MQSINAILGSELEIGTELTETQMELLCGGAEEIQDPQEDGGDNPEVSEEQIPEEYFSQY